MVVADIGRRLDAVSLQLAAFELYVHA